MTTLNSIFATITTTTFRTIAILLTIGMIMTSCQKDAMEELDTSIQETTELNEKGISGQYINEEAETTVFRSMEVLIKARAAKGTSRSSTLIIPEEIGCGYSERHSTTNSSNEIQTTTNPCYDNINNASFEGPDNHYFLTLTQTRTVHISISNLQADLDLFVFTLDSQGFPQACKARSTKIGLGEDEVTLSLNRGTYLVSVDGWRTDIKGAYTLEVSCAQTPPSSSDCTDSDLDWINNYKNLVECGAKIKLCKFQGRQVVDIDWRTCPIDFAGAIFECNGKLIKFYSRNDQKPVLTECKDITPAPTNDNCEEEDFSKYSLGTFISTQSSKWRTWSLGGNSQDATIIKSVSGQQILKVENRNDVVYNFGNKKSGTHVLSTRVYVRRDTEANFNIQEDFNDSNGGGFWAVKFKDGIGSFSRSLDHFAYPENTWIEIYMEFDMNKEEVEFVCVHNGKELARTTVKYDNLPNLGGINFFGVNAQSKFYVDYVRLNCEGLEWF